MAKYRFEQIAINSTEKKKPVEEDRFTYLGLEHLDSGSLKVTRFGSDVAPIGEKLVMRKGDVLFGKRRAYQKKVAIAPFDGIFSAHGMVLRPNVEVIDPDFFPLFISSDYFLDAAIKISVGSLSPTINWRDLKILEFDLPDLETQRKLAAVLWSINDTMESYKKLISATDELVKSQFMEQFGSYLGDETRCATVEQVCTVFADGDWIESKDQADDGIRLIQTGNVGNGVYLDKGERARYIDEETFVRLNCTEVLPNDILKKKAGGIAISIRNNELYTKEWQCRISIPTQSPTYLAKTAFALFVKNYQWEHPIRSVTVRAINLFEEDCPIQYDLFTDVKSLDRQERLDAAIEQIRFRFGKDAIKNGVLFQKSKMPTERKVDLVMPTGMIG